MPARITEIGVLASTWASGSQVCSGTTGSLMAKATKVSQKPAVAMPVVRATVLIWSKSKLPCPALNATSRMPASSSALEVRVKTRNFHAARTLPTPPQMAMSRNIGMSSTS